jgi:hypothetical protein
MKNFSVYLLFLKGIWVFEIGFCSKRKEWGEGFGGNLFGLGLAALGVSDASRDQRRHRVERVREERAFF